ncbi:MAG: adenylate/guanylate cyclase domain-containing protein [Bacteroidota bacterium]
MKALKRSYRLGFLLCCLLPLVSQAQDSSSVRQILAQAAALDSLDQAREKFEAAYALANQIGDERGVLLSLQNLVEIELTDKRSSNALRYLLEERDLLLKSQQLPQLVAANMRIGDLYQGETLFQEAIAYYKEAFANLNQVETPALRERLLAKLAYSYTEVLQPDSARLYYAALLDLPDKDAGFQLQQLRRIVLAYQQAGQYAPSLDYSLQIKDLVETAGGDYEGEKGSIYNNLGYTYNHLRKYESAIYWFQKAEPYFTTDNEKLAVIYTNLGIAHFNDRDYPKGIQYLLKALSLTDKTDYQKRAKISNVLANLYLDTQDYFNAQNYNRDAIALAEKSQNAALKSEVYETAADIHSLLYEYEEANQAYRTHLNLRDSLLFAMRLEQERLFQDKLKLEQTEKEIKLLLIRGEMQDLTINQQQLEIANLSLAAEKTENELEILRQSEQIKEARFENQQLETQRARQALQLVQGRLTLQERERQLSDLAEAEALTKLELAQKEALLKEEEQANALLAKDYEIQQQNTLAAQRIGLLLSILFLLVLAGLFYARSTNRKLRHQKLAIEQEQEKSERLLLNILPQSVAQELKEKGKTTPRYYESVSILFSDFVNFTVISARSTPEQILSEMNDCFMGFDAIMEEVGIEKIQTIGDGYLAVGGIPEEVPDHAERCVEAARRMIAFLAERRKHSEIKWRARIGIHSGPITAGVVGTKKFAYNIFGDTVNTASRIETAGEQGRINISAATYELIKQRYECEYRGKISAKGKGELDMYFVI